MFASINDEISQRTFKNYIKQLDPRKLYFLDSDVQEFSKQQNNLDDTLTGIIVLSCMVTMLSGIILAAVAGSLVTATKITDDYIWMKGAKPAFLDELPEWHGRE